VTTLWFVCPAHGRFKLTRICLEQLRRTCDALHGHGIDATAVVVADDDNLDTAHELGFATVRRDNRFLARKFNDGIQLACDPALNPSPADHVALIGSDDWVDHRILLDLPPLDTVLAFQWAAFVSEDGRQLAETRLGYLGGVGVRVYPRQLLEPRGYRPADEDRTRNCDFSILHNTRQANQPRPVRIDYGDLHARQVVDWKSPGQQLNSYADVTGVHRGGSIGNPFELLTGLYPDQALEQMADHYDRAPVAA
jgi:hypothetical protein